LARPKIELSDKDWEQVDKLCAIHCRKEEISAIIGISDDTLERRIKEKHGVSFAEYFAEKSATGKMSLRHKQYQTAMAGNVALLIFLGKNWLGQSDKQEITNLGESKQFILAYPLEKKDDDKLETDTE
jgi:hypothetical protein